MSIFLAALLKPFVLLALFTPGACAVTLIRRHMRDGPVKRFLLR